MDTETITQNVEAAQAPAAFDVLAFVEATAYPTEKIVLFQNPEAAAKYVKLSQKVNDSEDAPDPALEAEIEKLGDAIKKSSIVFELRGMPPGIVNEILKKGEGEDKTDEDARKVDHELIAKSIVRVTNHEGVADGRTWNADDVSRLRNFLKEGEFGKLLTAVANVNFSAAVFDEATDAGFSGRGVDVA